MELNVGGIVAAVLVTLILLGVLIFGIWFAYSRGYFESKWRPPPPRPCLVLLYPAGCSLSLRGLWVASEYGP